jgi:magnesium-transporting ATPase (P-type)
MRWKEVIAVLVGGWAILAAQAEPQRGPLLRFVLQFHNILLYVMLGSASSPRCWGIGWTPGVLLMAVVVNAIIGFMQEGKAESALDAIRAMLSPHAMVLRDGRAREIDAADLVPGDVVLLASGDRCPPICASCDAQGTAGR